MATAQSFDELTSWQRMHELDVAISAMADRPPIAGDFKFRSQITDAAGSAARNVAEGFARYHPEEFARFLDFSRASATEVRACLRKAVAAGHITESEFSRLDALARRGLQAVAKFQRYLRSSEARRNAKRARYSRARHDRNDSNPSNDPNDSNPSNDPNDSNPSNDPNDSNASNDSNDSNPSNDSNASNPSNDSIASNNSNDSNP